MAKKVEENEEIEEKKEFEISLSDTELSEVPGTTRKAVSSKWFGLVKEFILTGNVAREIVLPADLEEKEFKSIQDSLYKFLLKLKLCVGKGEGKDILIRETRNAKIYLHLIDESGLKTWLKDHKEFGEE